MFASVLKNNKFIDIKNFKSRC